MSKNLSPKCKQCRRAGEKLFLRGERCLSTKCALVKRNFPPGMHGSKGGGRLSEYGQQLREKQKAKKQYNLLEKQFKLTFEKAKKMAGNTGENFFVLLEERLDNVVYRLGLAVSRNQSRELVSHGHFTVNGRGVNIPSFRVKSGDIIKVKDKSKHSKAFTQLNDKLKTFSVPGWLHLEPTEFSGKVLHHPKFSDIKINVNPNMIVEFYSR